MTRRWLTVLTVAGVAAISAGVAWIYPPAGLIVAGNFALAAGLLIDGGDE